MLLHRFLILPALVLGACTSQTNGDDADGTEDAYTSASAHLLDFEFDGEATTADAGDPQQTVKDQMLFTIGQLNGKTGVGRLDKLVLTNVKTTAAGDLTTITYHAKLPVSLSKQSSVGRTHTMILPRRADWTGQDAFFKK